jgi:hypothetical protein
MSSVNILNKIDLMFIVIIKTVTKNFNGVIDLMFLKIHNNIYFVNEKY